MLHNELRKSVYEANVRLADTGLVRWTSGNASGRDSATGHVIIKPSGVLFDELTPENLVVLDKDGAVLEGNLRPSVDSASHLYVYRHRPDLGGIVHTHSKYATAFALAGLPLPVSSTTHASLFGGPVPCTGLAIIGEEEIGREIVDHIGEGCAVLLKNHGVFTVGKSPNEALKNAIYVEESAEASFLTRVLSGRIPELDAAFIAATRRMYLEDYGQPEEFKKS